MYIRKQFGRELKARVRQKQPISMIGEWAHSIYLQYIDDIDLDFRDILLTLNTMELGPEFAFTYKKLEQIADDLIAEKNVNL